VVRISIYQTFTPFICLLDTSTKSEVGFDIEPTCTRWCDTNIRVAFLRNYR